VMRLDPKRFWLTLLLPVTVVWILAGALASFPRRRTGMTDVARSNSPPA